MNGGTCTVTPSIRVFKGRQEIANYRDPSVPQYRGNPLIEALPPIWSDKEVAELLDDNNPAFNPDHRYLPAELRYHLLDTDMSQFFVTLPAHLDLHGRFSTMLRVGYLARNPASHEFWPEAEKRIAALGTSDATRRYRSTASGFTIIGPSGVGKSYGLEAVLNLYPQVIFHNHYQGRNLTFAQIVWLKLDCPFDGSIKGLCLNFFQAVDDLLRTHYYESFARRRTVDELLPLMARIASLHCLGALVIDEIQHLSEAKSGGPHKMLNFFVQLVNTIGVPVILIGTHKARTFLADQLRQIRRGSGQGEFEWKRMAEESEDWRLFVESLWDFQYTRKACPLTPQLSHALYHESQGIPDFAVKLFRFAQKRAISTGREEISAALIHSVARDNLPQAREVLEAIRKGDKRRLLRYEDIASDEVLGPTKPGTGGGKREEGRSREAPAGSAPDETPK